MRAASLAIGALDETEVVFPARRLCEEAEARQAEALKKIKIGGTTATGGTRNLADPPRVL